MIFLKGETMTATRKFTISEKFGFRLEHLDYRHSITPQGAFLVKKEVRRFRAYFLDIPLFDKNVCTNAACPRSDGGGGVLHQHNTSARNTSFGAKRFL